MAVFQFTAKPEKQNDRRIRIAVAVDDDGNWEAYGSSQCEENDTIGDLLEEQLLNLEGDAMQQYWLIVDIPLPSTEVLAGQTDEET